MSTGSEDGSHPQYLVVPLNQVSLVPITVITKTIDNPCTQVQNLTEKMDKMISELSHTNKIEADKIRFSKMKDIMLAKLSRIMERERQKMTQKGETDGDSDARNT